jgi:hypothetical protein
VFNKTIKEAHSVKAEYPNSHNFYSTIADNLQKYTDQKEELTTV